MNELLDRLRAHNEAAFEATGNFCQELLGSERLERGIPTLDPAVRRDASPLLRARFQYAGRWVYAVDGMTWLSPSDLEGADQRSPAKELLELRWKYWPDSPAPSAPRARVSLFGIDYEERQEVYLLWPEQGEGEPRIVDYASGAVLIYPDLAAYVEAVLSVPIESLVEASQAADEHMRSQRSKKSKPTRSPKSPPRSKRSSP